MTSLAPPVFRPPRFALVDFNNLCDSMRTESQVQDGLELAAQLLDEIVGLDHEGPPEDVEVRFYGGWRSRSGVTTEHGAWMLRNLRRVRGLRTAIRLIPQIALGPVWDGSVELVGLYKGKEQKMVDTLMAVDAIHLAGRPDVAQLILVTDDDDLVPAGLAIADHTSAQLTWLRPREVALNDFVFSKRSVQFKCLTGWTRQ